jgi:hypothetical protein
VLGLTESDSKTDNGAVGDCAFDSFSVTGAGGSGSPVICGYNTNQHSKHYHYLFSYKFE